MTDVATYIVMMLADQDQANSLTDYLIGHGFPAGTDGSNEVTIVLSKPTVALAVGELVRQWKKWWKHHDNMEVAEQAAAL